MTIRPQYDKDFYGWTYSQASLLRNRQLAELDMEHLIEEIESMGASERRALESCLEQLLMHLLKYQFQITHRSRSWLLSIKKQRIKISGILKRNPGLKGELKEMLGDAYQIGVISAAQETGLDIEVFPSVCSYSLEKILDEKFLPEDEEDEPRATF